MIKRILRLPSRLDNLLRGLVFRINPKTMMLFMAVIIFLVESLVMLIFNLIPPLKNGVEALVDSTILLLLLTSFYLHIYRPF